MINRFIVICLIVFVSGMLLRIIFRDGSMYVFSRAEGEIVYRYERLNGISWCEMFQSQGCFDGYIDAALRDEKTGKEKIDTMCEIHKKTPQEYSRCVAWTGHGLFMSLNVRKVEDFLKGRAVCDTRSIDPDLCFRGMLEAASSYIPKHPGLMSIDNICTQLDQKYQPNCYFFGPPVWQLVDHLNIAELGKRCSLLGWSRNREECFGGIGRLITDNPKYTAESINTDCTRMPTSEGRTFCTIESMRSMFVDHKTKPLAVCSFLEGEYQHICLTAGKQFACHVMLSCSDKEPPASITVGGTEIKTIGYNSPESEKNVFNRAIDSAAQKNNTIEISDTCGLSPGVADIYPTKPLELMNRSPYNHDISFAEQTYHVAIGKSVTMSAHLTEGIYGVSCDGSLKGYFLVK